MLTLDSLNPDKKLSAFLAIKFAEKGLPAYEVYFPEDKRPRAAIEAAQAWLNDSSVDNADAARAAANAAADAADAATAAGNAAGNAARDAADVAAGVAYAAVANAAAWSADALGKDKASFIHSVLMENADVILERVIKEKSAS